MGRYPFKAAANKYLDAREGFVSPKTHQVVGQRFHRLGEIFDQLKELGKVKSTDPRIMGTDDIRALVLFMEREGLQQSTQSAYLTTLNKLLLHQGNPVLERIRSEGGRLPKSIPKDLQSLEESDIRSIQKAARTLKGWQGSIARFLTFVYPSTGLRMSELRLADIDHLDTKNWTLYVAHPKGERSYGKKRIVLILPQARGAVTEFLTERERYLEKAGFPDAKPLIPCYYRGEIRYYSQSGLYPIKQKVEAIAGISFKFKDYRDAFAQLTVDRDPSSLSAVSRQLGHRTTLTTELHYARIRSGNALKALEEVWSDHNPKSNFIEKKEFLSGYS